MHRLSARRLLLGLFLSAAALGAAGCAGGTSRSIAMAPLSFTAGEEDDLIVARSDTAPTAAVVALAGDFKAGVTGYDVVGGNALLPSRPVPASLIPVATPLVSLPGVLGLAAELPGAAPNVLTAATAPLTAALDAGVAELGAVAPPLAASPPPGELTGPVVGLAGPSIDAALAPVTAPVSAPVNTVTAAVEPAVTSLVTQGAGLLAAPPAPSAAPPTAAALTGGAVTSVLNTLRRGP